MTAHVVIIGGGISGLAAAERLLELLPDARVTLLEASERLGGVIRTERRDGRIMECGPDVFLASKPAARELCERLGVPLQTTNPAAHGASVVRKGRLHRVPAGLQGLVPTRLPPFLTTRLLSPLGKLRAAMEPYVPARRDSDDESVASFVRRRLGDEMYDRLFEPLLSGIHAGDGERLSILATFPQLRENERVHGGLLRAARHERAERASGATSVTGAAPSGFLAPREGMGAMIDALAARLASRVEVRLGERVGAVTPLDGAARVQLAGGTTIEADAAIVAAPAREAATMLASGASTLARLLGEITYASTATISLAYRAAEVPPVEGTGYVVPRAEARPALAATFVSNKLIGRAPEGERLFRVFFGGVGRADVVGASDAALIEAARTELAGMIGVRAEPIDVLVSRWERAMPQYDLGHPARVREIERTVGSIPALALAGNAYRGVGIPDCIRSGQDAARAVSDYLSGARLSVLGARL